MPLDTSFAPRLLSWLLVLQDHLLSSVGLAPTELNGLAMKSSGLAPLQLSEGAIRLLVCHAR